MKTMDAQGLGVKASNFSRVVPRPEEALCFEISVCDSCQCKRDYDFVICVRVGREVAHWELGSWFCTPDCQKQWSKKSYQEVMLFT